MFLLALKIVLQISDFRVHFNFSFQESDNLYKEIHKSLHLCIIFVRKLDTFGKYMNEQILLGNINMLKYIYLHYLSLFGRFARV